MAEPIFAWHHVPVEAAPARAAGAVSLAFSTSARSGLPTSRLPTVEFREQRVAVERDRFFGTTADLADGISTGSWAATSLPGGNTPRGRRSSITSVASPSQLT
jgi:hypothetical protein